MDNLANGTIVDGAPALGAADLAARMEDGCLRQLLAAEADRAAERGKRLANLLEKALTTENNLLKW